MSDAHLMFGLVEQVNHVLVTLPTRERLAVLLGAYLLTASNARSEAASFTEEQARQVDQLRALADVIAGDVPDPEMERLAQAGDVEGIRRRALDLMKRGGFVQ
jgi:hypothetical protein